MPPSKHKYRDMLQQTGAEKLSRVEMLATAVTLDLEGAPTEMQDDAAGDPAVAAVMGGMLPRHSLSAGLCAIPFNGHGEPLTAAHVVASGNLAGDMVADVVAESTWRTLAARLYQTTDALRAKNTLRYLLVQDAIPQDQWPAVIEELDGTEAVHPIPASIPLEEEQKGPHVEEMNLQYAFMATGRDKHDGFDGARFTSETSVDGKGEFSFIDQMGALGDVAKSGLAKAAQKAKDVLS